MQWHIFRRLSPVKAKRTALRGETLCLISAGTLTVPEHEELGQLQRRRMGPISLCPAVISPRPPRSQLQLCKNSDFYI